MGIKISMVALSASSGVEDLSYVSSNDEGLVTLGPSAGNNNDYSFGFACSSSPWDDLTASKACGALGKDERGAYTLSGQNPNGGSYSATSVQCSSSQDFNTGANNNACAYTVATGHCTGSQALFISCVPAFSGSASNFLRFRLTSTVDGTSAISGRSGFLQAKVGDLEYGAVCGTGLLQASANNVCKLLGLDGTALIQTAQNTGGSSDYALHDLQCSSAVTSASCEFDRTPVCSANNAVNLMCMEPSPSPSTTAVRKSVSIAPV